ncbi:hypothetical protein D0T49_06520 [Paludibacter sp. 221]|nr:hypothetical protein [Paludibacter sp. 221]
MNLNGKVKSMKESRYDAVEKFGEAVPDEDSEPTVVVWHFNKDGNIQKEFREKRDDLFLSKEYIYEKGKLKEIIEYAQNGEIRRKNLFIDNEGVIEELSYDKDGNLKGKYINKYDDKNNLVEIASYDSEGNINFKFVYKYDDRGNRIELKSYSSDGKPMYISTSKYNDKNLLIQSEFTNVHFDEYTHENYYEYVTFDKHKSWTKRIEYDEDSAPEGIIIREIEYY